MKPAFAAVVIDVDSTLCGVEGIDFLAARRGGDVGSRIAALTDRAMRGEAMLESVYGERLTIVRPTEADIAALADEYRETVAPGAPNAIAAMRAAGVHLILISGGVRQAIAPLARALGFTDRDLFAVSLTFDSAGRYVSFDKSSPLATQSGKPEVVTRLLAEGRLTRPLLAVGDGATDVPLRGIADTFAAFTGFARRQRVVENADVELASFAELEQVVIGTRS
ncbi:MAG TPA: HAD-IB family phosphatase [Gemmatimonadaceae bacterium]|nr:HAD-IB family phosphatase [Gemmatimonadaceae bacterium]